MSEGGAVTVVVYQDRTRLKMALDGPHYQSFSGSTDKDSTIAGIVERPPDALLSSLDNYPLVDSYPRDYTPILILGQQLGSDGGRIMKCQAENVQYSSGSQLFWYQRGYNPICTDPTQPYCLHTYLDIRFFDVARR